MASPPWQIPRAYSSPSQPLITNIIALARDLCKSRDHVGSGVDGERALASNVVVRDRKSKEVEDADCRKHFAKLIDLVVVS